MNYRIYGMNRSKGMELIETTYIEEKMYEILDNIDSNAYSVILVIRHNIKQNYGEPYIVRSLIRDMKRERNRKI